MLPFSALQCRSLLEVLRQAPELRGSNTHFRIGPVLTLAAMALLAGARDVAEIARFATVCTQTACRPRAAYKKGTRRFYEVPGYSVFTRS